MPADFPWPDISDAASLPYARHGSRKFEEREPRRAPTRSSFSAPILFGCHPERGCRVEGPPRSDSTADLTDHLSFQSATATIGLLITPCVWNCRALKNNVT